MARITRARFARTMYLDQVLLMFDGPQVVLMKSDRGYSAIGVAIDDENPYGTAHYIHFSEVTDDVLRRYLSEKVDLRYVFKEGSKKRYLADWADLDEKGWIKVDRANDITNEEWFPAHGFWARNHSEELKAHGTQSSKLATFAIDGSWDASDFSRFYGKVADLYAFLSIASEERVQGLGSSASDAVKDVIKKLGWQGGGSYVGFYDSIFSRVYALAPLIVRRIQYASPGVIDLKGSEGPLADVARVVDQFGADDGSLKLAYSVVDRILANEGLRSAPLGTPFASDERRRIVQVSCFEINLKLGIDDPGRLLDLCEGNVVVFAKITLSFYRRARDLHKFHSEGRVTSRGISDDAPAETDGIWDDIFSS